MRKSTEPAPSIVAVPKMLADRPSSEQRTARMAIEWRFMSTAGAGARYSSWPDGPVPLALPPKVALSPAAVWIGPPPVTLQRAVLVGRPHVLVAVALGSVPFCPPLLSVSAKAVI